MYRSTKSFQAPGSFRRQRSMRLRSRSRNGTERPPLGEARITRGVGRTPALGERHKLLNSIISGSVGNQGVAGRRANWADRGNWTENPAWHGPCDAKHAGPGG